MILLKYQLIIIFSLYILLSGCEPMTESSIKGIWTLTYRYDAPELYERTGANYMFAEGNAYFLAENSINDFQVAGNYHYSMSSNILKLSNSKMSSKNIKYEINEGTYCVYSYEDKMIWYDGSISGITGKEIYRFIKK